MAASGQPATRSSRPRRGTHRSRQLGSIPSATWSRASGTCLRRSRCAGNPGVHNVRTHLTGNIPVGASSPVRLSNIGIGHSALDGGAGYTYFNEQTGYEFSAVAGLTYNFINPYTQYQSGVDVHLDWGASRFLTKQ